MDRSGIALIAGLGNPGTQYSATRHNVGFWFVEQLQQQYQINFSIEKKFKSETGQFDCNGDSVRVVVPNTFMNLSGESIAPMVSFYRMNSAQLLVVHDDLDLPPGCIRLKIGGGHGGHNGLRDIVSKLGSPDFVRLRIGIGHPGTNNNVSGYVLQKPPVSDIQLIEDAIHNAINLLPEIVSGDYQNVMNVLHNDGQKDKENDKDNSTDKKLSNGN